MNAAPSTASARLHATLNANRARLGITTQTQRTPDRGTASNAADCVERQMREDGHTRWGWIIYRCTYEDDEQWRRFMERLLDWSYLTLQYHNALDMQGSLNIEVHESKENYDGATPEEIASFFMNWTRLEGIHEHGNLGMSQRYRYCIHVDQEAVDSVLFGPGPPQDMLGRGYVNLVRVPAGWSVFVESGKADEYMASGKELDGECAMNNEEDWELEEGEEEPPEGWDEAFHTRVSYTGLVVNTYGMFRHKSAWRKYYCAPPEQVSRFPIHDDTGLGPMDF